MVTSYVPSKVHFQCEYSLLTNLLKAAQHQVISSRLCLSTEEDEAIKYSTVIREIFIVAKIS